VIRNKVITIKISDIVNRYITVGNDKYINNYLINGIANKAHDDLTIVRHNNKHAVSISNSNIAKSKVCINNKQLKVINSKV
jgi:hypothetical protein